MKWVVCQLPFLPFLGKGEEFFIRFNTCTFFFFGSFIMKQIKLQNKNFLRDILKKLIELEIHSL